MVRSASRPEMSSLSGRGGVGLTEMKRSRPYSLYFVLGGSEADNNQTSQNVLFSLIISQHRLKFQIFECLSTYWKSSRFDP